MPSASAYRAAIQSPAPPTGERKLRRVSPTFEVGQDFHIAANRSHGVAMEFFRDLVRWVSSGEDRESIESRNALERQVFAVPLDDAKNEVARYLSDPAKFIVERAQTGLVLPPSVDTLPPLVGEFFAAYDSVQETEGFVWLSRANIARSEIDGQLIRIGLDAEHAEVVVKAGAEDVYVTD